MSEAINAHKKMAMGITEGNKMKKGGIAKYAKGGAVMSEKGVATLPAKTSAPPPLARPAAGMAGKIATLKKGGAAKPMRKAAGRGR